VIQNKCVLIVEDDDSIRDTLKILLEDEGYSVVTAANGREGIERLKSCARPALIILDLMMPVMSGWEFLKARNQEELGMADIPVITVSAGASATPPAGASAFIKKPFETGRSSPSLYSLGNSSSDCLKNESAVRAFRELRRELRPTGRAAS
jgi:CheY-like chemotaxis protein